MATQTLGLRSPSQESPLCINRRAQRKNLKNRAKNETDTNSALRPIDRIDLRAISIWHKKAWGCGGFLAIATVFL